MKKKSRRSNFFSFFLLIFVVCHQSGADQPRWFPVTMLIGNITIYRKVIRFLVFAIRPKSPISDHYLASKKKITRYTLFFSGV